jgi:hypothetical protein
MSPRKKKVPAARARRPTRARIKKVSAVMRQLGGASLTAPRLDHDARFEEVVALVEAARGRAYEAVNSELVSLYWQLGEHISRKIASAEWGDGVVEELATELARRYPGLRGSHDPAGRAGATGLIGLIGHGELLLLAAAPLTFPVPFAWQVPACCASERARRSSRSCARAPEALLGDTLDGGGDVQAGATPAPHRLQRGV